MRPSLHPTLLHPQLKPVLAFLLPFMYVHAFVTSSVDSPDDAKYAHCLESSLVLPWEVLTEMLSGL